MFLVTWLLRYENATMNPKMLMIDVFSILLCLHSTIKKSKIILSKYLYNWKGIEYPTAINKNSYTLFEKNIYAETALIVFYVDADV